MTQANDKEPQRTGPDVPVRKDTPISDKPKPATKEEDDDRPTVPKPDRGVAPGITGN